MVGRFRQLEAELRERSYGRLIDRGESIAAPANADEFAERSIYVICNSGMRVTVAAPIYMRCMEALRSVVDILAHTGKASAVDRIWAERERFFAAFLRSSDGLAFLETLPWIDPITRHHLAKTWSGRNQARRALAAACQRSRTTVARLCARLSRRTGYGAATTASMTYNQNINLCAV